MRTITGTVLTVDGLPVANTEVLFTLVNNKALPISSFDAVTHGRVYGTKTVTTDASGVFSISLWENTKLVDESYYLVQVDIEDDTPFIAALTEGVAALDWLEFKVAGQTVTPAQLLILEEFINRAELGASEAEASAIASETSRTASAASATASSDSAAASEASKIASGNSATASSASAAASANSATAAASSATASEASKVASGDSASASAASASASETSRTASAASATASSDSASSANAAKTAAEAALDSFDDRNLGSKTTAPTVDNDGNALISGAEYFNSTEKKKYVWDATGLAWVLSSFVPTAHASLTGLSDADTHPISSITGLEKALSEATYDETIFQIGVMGSVGAGVSAIPSHLLPVGYTRLDGHYEPASANHGNVLDPTGSVMVWVPRFFVRWNVNNTVDISGVPKAGYVLHRAFIDGGVELEGFLVDKYGCGNVAGIFASKQGIDPCSTAVAHNPISALNNAPVNNYGGLYKAVKTRGANHFLTSIFIYNALATLAHAQGQAGTNCAFSDIAPLHPKGNNNNALKDVNDASVTFSGSGYLNCAMTGSGVPFAKTTHNGQACGVADLNGNMWEVASGFIKYGATDAIFKILKESTRLGDILTDSITTGAGGAYDINLYDDLDLTGSMAGTGVASKFGNGANQVFMMNTNRASEQYKMTMAGLPMIGGYSAAGTTAFGNDYYYEYWRDQMAPVVGGAWGASTAAGVFLLDVANYRAYSNGSVGGRASVYL